MVGTWRNWLALDCCLWVYVVGQNHGVLVDGQHFPVGVSDVRKVKILQRSDAARLVVDAVVFDVSEIVGQQLPKRIPVLLFDCVPSGLFLGDDVGFGWSSGRFHFTAFVRV